MNINPEFLQIKNDKIDPAWKVSEWSLPDCDSIVEVATRLGVTIEYLANGDATGICPECIASVDGLGLVKKVLQGDYEAAELFPGQEHNLHFGWDSICEDKNQFYCRNCYTGGGILTYVAMYFTFINPINGVSLITETATQWLIKNYSAESLCKITLNNSECECEDCENYDYLINLISEKPVVLKSMVSNFIEYRVEQYHDYIVELVA